MIDTSMLLQARPVDIPGAQLQAQNLANLGTQNQLQQGALAAQPGQLEAQRQENQQRQDQIDQTKVLNDAYAGAYTPGVNGAPGTFDTAKLTSAVALHNKGSAIPGIMKGITESQTLATDLATKKSKLASDQAEYGGSIGATTKDAGYSPQVLLTQAQHGLDAGAIDPNVAKPIIAQLTQSLQADPTGAQAKALTQQLSDQLISGSPAQQKIIAEKQTAQAHADTAATSQQKEAAELGGQQADTAQKVRANASALLGQAKTPAETAQIMGSLPYAVAKQFEGKTPAEAQAMGLTSEQSTTSAQAAATAKETQVRDANTARHERVDEGMQGARLNVEQSNAQVARAAADPWGALGLNAHPMGGGAGAAGGTALHGEGFLKTLPPQMAGTVKAVSEGRQTNLPRGGKELDQLMGAVNQYDPTYSAQRAQIRTAFSTGKQGQNIDNLNTAVVHLDQYHEVMKAMNNGSFVPGNQLYNFIAGKLGAANVTNPDFVRQSLAGEAANALKGNATDPEIAGLMTTLGKNQGPAQQEGTALEGLKILGTKLNTYDEHYHELSTPDDTWSPVRPSAKAVFDRYGLQPIARTASAPAAGAASAPAKLASAFKETAVGPGGHQIGSNDGQKTWFDLATGKKIQ